MASHDQPYNSTFKATVALEALRQSKRNLDQLSEKYDVPVSLILTWATQLERNASTIYATTEAPEDIPGHITHQRQTVDIQVADEDIKESLFHGVMHDDLNYKKLLFWAVLGILFFVIFVQLLVEMYQNNVQVVDERSATQNEYYQSNIQKKQDQKRLSTFGVVDLDKGVYRMPIDSAIDEMAANTQNKDTTK